MCFIGDVKHLHDTDIFMGIIGFLIPKNLGIGNEIATPSCVRAQIMAEYVISYILMAFIVNMCSPP